jgi:hypothetical protein
MSLEFRNKFHRVLARPIVLDVIFAADPRFDVKRTPLRACRNAAPFGSNDTFASGEIRIPSASLSQRGRFRNLKK